MASKSSRASTIFGIIGFCAFVSFMCSGVCWLLGVVGVTFELLNTIAMVASLVLNIAAFVAGWFWLDSAFEKGTLKTVLQVFFVIFTILALCGVLSNYSIL